MLIVIKLLAIIIVIKLLAWFEKLFRCAFFDSIFSELSNPVKIWNWELNGPFWLRFVNKFKQKRFCHRNTSSHKYCLIGNPPGTLTWLIGDWHTSLETDMPDRSPIGNWHACGDPSETIMPTESNRNFNKFEYLYFYNNLLGHVGFRWVSDVAWSGLRWVSEVSVFWGSRDYCHDM